MLNGISKGTSSNSIDTDIKIIVKEHHVYARLVIFSEFIGSCELFKQ